MSDAGSAARLRRTNVRSRRGLRSWMARASISFPGAGLAANQDRGIGRRHGFDGLQHALQRRALADDAAEVVLQPYLGLEVLLLLGEMVFEAHDFLVRERVFHRDRDLRGDLLQQLEFLYGECIRIDARDIERPERAAPRHQRERSITTEATAAAAAAHP